MHDCKTPSPASSYVGGLGASRNPPDEMVLWKREGIPFGGLRQKTANPPYELCLAADVGDMVLEYIRQELEAQIVGGEA